ncbi:unnamed protein product [Dovyalis caffra]|uniref:J domain-containing protein n=1 Tax=Dovyalis caffra TaxID=77055 RepID=A0AAV1S180_9ROSI|nr:unnamed protein product [Dovyalis caffra]
MTDLMLGYAEEQFFDKKFRAAYDTAMLAKNLDPFFGNGCIEKHLTVYQVHASSLYKNRLTGDTDWHRVLGINDIKASRKEIMVRFCKILKIIHPDYNSCAAAQGAFELISRALVALLRDSRKIVEILLDFAEREFLENRFKEAYDVAKLALLVDPSFGNGCPHRYVATYRVHAATLLNRFGEINWYNVLGIDNYWVSEGKILSRFCRMGKLICLDNDCSVAGKVAYQIISRAVEVLGDPERRAEFHRRWGLKPPPYAKEEMR